MRASTTRAALQKEIMIHVVAVAVQKVWIKEMPALLGALTTKNVEGSLIKIGVYQNRVWIM